MIDKTLCSDFAMCIFDRFVDGDTFEKYAKIVRNLIDALMFDSTISSSDAVAFVQEMVKQAGSRGFNFSNETDINNLTKYIISLDISARQSALESAFIQLGSSSGLSFTESARSASGLRKMQFAGGLPSA